LDQNDEIALELGWPAVMPEKTGSKEYIPEMWLISPPRQPLFLLFFFFLSLSCRDNKSERNHDK
jgi:hypothetical protein